MDILYAPDVHKGRYSHELRVGTTSITLDHTGFVRVNGEMVGMSARRQQLLATLIRAEGGIITHERVDELLRKGDTFPSKDSVRMQIHLVRTCLDGCAPGVSEMIKTIDGVGYRIDSEAYTYPSVLLEHAMMNIDDIKIGFPTWGGVTVNGSIITNSFHKTALLRMLCEAPGQILTWNTFATRVYGPDSSIWPINKILDVYICKLRKALKSATGRNLIETAWGRGYRLDVSIPDPLKPTVTKSVSRIIGPMGSPITTRDLPDPSKPIRWVISKKATVAMLVDRGAISTEDVLKYYPDLPESELEQWIALIKIGGMKALRQTHRAPQL